MNQRFPIFGAQILGAMTPPTSRAAFNRANLVVRGQSGTILSVQLYTCEDAVEGSAFRPDQWEALLASGHALALPEPVSLVSGAALWVLRPTYSRRAAALNELRAGRALLRDYIAGNDNSWLCLVNEGTAYANTLRERWFHRAMKLAKSFALSARWSDVLAEAEIAFAIAPALDAEALALLSFAYERCGRSLRAEGTITMARGARGEDFAREVTQLRRSIENELSFITDFPDDPQVRTITQKLYQSGWLSPGVDGMLHFTSVNGYCLFLKELAPRIEFTLATVQNPLDFINEAFADYVTAILANGGQVGYILRTPEHEAEFDRWKDGTIRSMLRRLMPLRKIEDALMRLTRLPRTKLKFMHTQGITRLRGSDFLIGAEARQSQGTDGTTTSVHTVRPGDANDVLSYIVACLVDALTPAMNNDPTAEIADRAAAGWLLEAKLLDQSQEAAIRILLSTNPPEPRISEDRR